MNGRAGAVRSMFDFYVTRGRTQIQSEFQYRAATYFWMIGMLAEPIVYLVVWTTIAEQQGGSVQGITTGEFAAYYIVWTLVRWLNTGRTLPMSASKVPAYRHIRAVCFSGFLAALPLASGGTKVSADAQLTEACPPDRRLRGPLRAPLTARAWQRSAMAFGSPPGP